MTGQGEGEATKCEAETDEDKTQIARLVIYIRRPSRSPFLDSHRLPPLFCSVHVTSSTAVQVEFRERAYYFFRAKRASVISLAFVSTIVPALRFPSSSEGQPPIPSSVIRRPSSKDHPVIVRTRSSRRLLRRIKL